MKINPATLYHARTAYFESDISFLKQIPLNNSAKILELGCGTGRILTHFYSNGYNVTGLDICEDSLDIARCFMPNAKLFNKDINSFELDQKFDLIILAFNTLELITCIEDQKLLLSNIKKHLSDKGILYIHTTPLDIESFVSETNPRVIKTISLESVGEVKVEYSAIRNLKNRISKVTFKYFYFLDGSREYTEDSYVVKPMTYNEVHLLLQITGFNVTNSYGDFDMTLFEEGKSSTLIILAKLSQ